jgi:hypothetical protein
MNCKIQPTSLISRICNFKIADVSFHTYCLPAPGDILLKYVAAKCRTSWKKKKKCLKTVVVEGQMPLLHGSNNRLEKLALLEASYFEFITVYY